MDLWVDLPGAGAATAPAETAGPIARVGIEGEGAIGLQHGRTGVVSEGDDVGVGGGSYRFIYALRG